jgi:hypothetical protein
VEAGGFRRSLCSIVALIRFTGGKWLFSAALMEKEYSQVSSGGAEIEEPRSDASGVGNSRVDEALGIQSA